MAVFNSIALGKSRGSIGNVTTARLKGQGVAKSKITQTTNVNSVGQVTSRGKMSNIVMAYQYLALFLVNAVALRKQTESVYNAFVRGFKTEISEDIADSKAAAAALLTGLAGLSGNFITVSDVLILNGIGTVSLNPGGLPWVSDAILRVITYNSNTGQSLVTSVAVTESQWNAGEVVLTDQLLGGNKAGAYIYSPLEKKCSNILFA